MNNRNRNSKIHKIVLVNYCAQNGPCTPSSNFETLITNFEVEKWNFELKLRNSKMKLSKNFLEKNLSWDLYFKVLFIFQIWCYQLVYKANHKICKKKVSRKIRKILCSSRLEFRSFNSKFILNFEVSDQSFEVRRHAWTVLTINVCQRRNETLGDMMGQITAKLMEKNGRSTLQIPQNLLRNVLLIWEMCSDQENIGIFFSKQENLTHWEKFSCPFCKTEKNYCPFWPEFRIYLKTRLNFFILRRLYLTRKYFLFQENCSHFEKTIFLN